MNQINRRHFLKTAGAITVGLSGLKLLLDSPGAAWAKPSTSIYGPLVRDPKGFLDLPKGFEYKIFSTLGETMDDGFLVPGLHDGMAAFPGDQGRTILVRNHELMATPRQYNMSPFAKITDSAAAPDPAKVYDRIPRNLLPPEAQASLPEGLDVLCGGGTTTLVYDTQKQELVEHYLSLVGTLRNCAGGPTPWGSWITCEEIVVIGHDKLQKDHGYNFEVPANHRGLVDPVPLRAMGRFNHEAVAVDPNTYIIYQTEDRPDSLIYRFLPNENEDPSKGGRLQALAMVNGMKSTRNWEGEDTFPTGKPLHATWIDVDDIDGEADDLRIRGAEAGAAIFARGEGMAFGNDGVYFVCTSGGREQIGQVFKYTPSPHEGTAREKDAPGTLTLELEPNDSNLVDGIDNIVVAPSGDLILCEDGGGTQFIRGVTPEGTIYNIAKNAENESEFAGACFSADGSTMFVNVQGLGRTVAITGPWRA